VTRERGTSTATGWRMGWIRSAAIAACAIIAVGLGSAPADAQRTRTGEAARPVVIMEISAAAFISPSRSITAGVSTVEIWS